MCCDEGKYQIDYCTLPVYREKAGCLVEASGMEGKERGRNLDWRRDRETEVGKLGQSRAELEGREED